MFTARRVTVMSVGLMALVIAVAMIAMNHQARAQTGTGATVAPDLQSVGNFRPGPVDNNGDFRTLVDFTFDQPTFLSGSNRTSFGLVPTGGGDSVFGSDFNPENDPGVEDPPGDNTITVLFNGDVGPGDFARGFISNDTASSDAQGNAATNINQAQPISPNPASVNPDLGSVRVDCTQNQVFFTFDQPLDQEDVIQNTGGLRLYFEDTTNAGAQSVNFVDGSPETVRAVFSDLPEGKTLSDAVGAYVTNGTVAGNPPGGPGGQLMNQFDETRSIELGAGCQTPGTTMMGTTMEETTTPETTMEETTSPGTTMMDTTMEETTAPETTMGETTAPETTMEETTTPDTTMMETTAPETTMEETAMPGTTMPEETTMMEETTTPGTTAPETTMMETTSSETTMEETTMPGTTSPEETTTPEESTPEESTPEETTTPESNGSEGPSQEANQSNNQSGTATGGGSVVNNASNVAQQCQTGGQVVNGNGNVVVNQTQCSQIVNSVQAGDSAEQAVSNVVDQDQSEAGVQYETPEAPSDEASAPTDEEAAPAEEVAPVVEESVIEAGGTEDQSDAAASAAVSAAADGGDAEAAASDAASAATDAGAGEEVADAAYSAAEDAVAGDIAADDSAGISELPDTGGAPLFMLLGGTLLVGGALLVRRIL